MEIILNLDWLKVVYIVGAIGILTLAIIAYPTFKYGPKDDNYDEERPRESSKHKVVKSR